MTVNFSVEDERGQTAAKQAAKQAAKPPKKKPPRVCQTQTPVLQSINREAQSIIADNRGNLMSKLYYIIGNDAQIREKVYCEILKWSQAQQMDPLQPYSTLEEETPNFYLYNYLGQGEKEDFGKLTETYGEEVVETIYLRTPEETEERLLAEGIYQSYDPYENLAGCLQEIVETVFTGYRKTAYDFVAVLRAAAMQEQAAKEAAQQAEQQASQAQEEAQRTKVLVQKALQLLKKLLKKMALPAAILVSWALIVCLITVAIFNGVNNPKEAHKGNLISVTMAPPQDTAPFFPEVDLDALPTQTPITTPATTPATSPTTTPITTPITTSAPDIVGPLPFLELKAGQSVHFTEPMTEADSLDIIGPVLQNGEYGYYAVYSGSDTVYCMPCVDSGTDGDCYAQSIDGKVGLILADNVLWYLDKTRIENIADSALLCAISATGQYVFYATKEGVFSYDCEQNKWESLVAFPSEDTIDVSNGKATLMASPNGDYCAYLDAEGVVTIVNRSTKETKVIAGQTFQSISAVADSSALVYGIVKAEGTNYLARVSRNGAVSLLTKDTDKKCYITFDGMQVLYEKDGDLWICDEWDTRTQLISVQENHWQLFLTEKESLYASADNVYLYDGDLNANRIRLGNDGIYLIQQKNTGPAQTFSLTLQVGNLLWVGDHEYLHLEDGMVKRNATLAKTVFAFEIPDTQLEQMYQILACDQYGSVLYLDEGDGLYYYSLENQAEPQYVMDFSSRQIHSYFVTGDSSAIYYFTNDGVLGVVQLHIVFGDNKTWGNYANQELQHFDFLAGRMAFEEKNNGVYFYYLSGTSSFSMPELYFLTEHQSVYLGHSNFP